MKIGATISPALLSLLTNKQIDVEYAEVNDERTRTAVITLESRLPSEEALRAEVRSVRQVL